MPDPAEIELIKKCQEGREEAFRELVEKYQRRVYSIAWHLLSNYDTAREISQEVFLRVFRSLRRWDSSRPLKPWIMGITVNRCRTWLAQRVRRPELADYLQDVAVAPDADDAAELLHEIQAALRELRPEFREVFVLYHEQGQSYEEIAQALGCPLGTVKTWLHRARIEVLERLQERGMVHSEP